MNMIITGMVIKIKIIAHAVMMITTTAIMIMLIMAVLLMMIITGVMKMR